MAAEAGEMEGRMGRDADGDVSVTVSALEVEGRSQDLSAFAPNLPT